MGKINAKALAGMLKPPSRYVTPQMILHLGQALEDGGLKYNIANWRDDPVDILTYWDATIRHWGAYLDGEEIDPKSGRHHLAHAMAQPAILLDAMENGCLIDNRYTPGNTPELIKKLSKE